jgi:hypothetical protein
MRYSPRDAHERLVEWGEEKHYPGWATPQTTGGVLGRLSDEGQFQEVHKAFCKHISKAYWPGLTPEQVEGMAGLMGRAA